MKGLRYVAVSHPGVVRKRNEDAWGLFLPGGEALLTGDGMSSGSVNLSDRGLVAMVSDGMGGAKAGDYASRTIVATLYERLAEVSADPGNQVRAVLEAIHRRLIEESQEDPEKAGMGGTCTLGWFYPDGELQLIHVGDSRLYRCREGELALLTEDQTVAAQFIASGEVTEAEARSNRYWHVLLQAIGGGEDRPISPQVRSVRFRSGDRIFLCTDGVTDGLLDPQLLGLVQRKGRKSGLEAAGKAILDAALSASGRDNITFILGEVF